MTNTNVIQGPWANRYNCVFCNQDYAELVVLDERRVCRICAEIVVSLVLFDESCVKQDLFIR